MHRGAELQETHTFIPAHAQYTARAPKSGPSPNPAGIPYFSPPNQDGLRPFLPLQAAQPPPPNQPPVGFQPGSSQHMELKGKEQIQALEGRLDIAFTCKSRALEEKADMWQERMGHQKGALLFLSSSGQSQPGWFSSPGGEQSSSRMARTPPAPSQNEQAWVQQGKPHHPPQHQLLGCIKHPMPNTASHSQPQATTIRRGLGAHPNSFSKLAPHCSARPSNCIEQRQKKPPQTLYM